MKNAEYAGTTKRKARSVMTASLVLKMNAETTDYEKDSTKMGSLTSRTVRQGKQESEGEGR